MSHALETLNAGKVVVDIGHVTKEERRELDKLVRKGVALKWRGRWYSVPGAQFGIGPLKTCWALKP